jgi:hypothetical protein
MNILPTQAALIVHGLSLSVTSEDLMEMFTPYGEVIWTRVVMDRFRRSMAYGYVVMASDWSAPPGTRQSRLASRAGQLMMLGLAHHVLELTGGPIAQG